MLRYKKYYYENNFTKYGAIRSAVSAYLKKYKRKLPEKLTYRQFVRQLYDAHKEEPIRKLHKSLEGHIVEEIEPTGQWSNEFWLFDQWTEDYKADKLIIVDMRPLIGEEYYFKGTIGEFRSEHLSNFIRAVNLKYERAVYVYFLYEEFTNKKGQRILYCLLIEQGIDDIIARAEYFNVREYLESLGYEFDVEAAERPAIPGIEFPPAVPPPPTPEAERIKALEEERKKLEEERKKLEIEKEVIELRRKERAETAKLVREFIEKGFTPEQIMKLFGIKE